MKWVLLKRYYFIFIFIAYGLIYYSEFLNKRGNFDLAHLLFILLILLTTYWRFSAIFRSLGKTELPDFKDRWEFFLISTATLWIILQVTGGSDSFLYPLNYALISILSSFGSFTESIILIFVSASFEALPFIKNGLHSENITDLLTHITYLFIFSICIGTILRLERQKKERALNVIKTIEEDAKMLVSTTGEPEDLSEESHERVRYRMIMAFDYTLYSILEEIKNILNSYSCVLLMADFEGRKLRVREACCDEDVVDFHSSINLEESIFNWVYKNKKPLYLSKSSRDRKTLFYYKYSLKEGSIVIFPLIRDDKVLGLLCLDSPKEGFFNSDDIKFLPLISKYIIDIIETIRTIQKIQKDTKEFQGLFEVSKKLSDKLQLADLLNFFSEAIARIIDASSVIILIKEGERIMIKSVLGDISSEVLGLEISSREGIVGWSLLNKQYLYYPDVMLKEFKKPLISKNVTIPYARSFLCIPFVLKGETLGGVVITSRNTNAFSPYEIKILWVLCNQASILISNSMLYERMEQLATIDGLTGLMNHRQFQEAFIRELARADRYRENLSVGMVDIDNFKKINDTFGHLVGDEILKNISRILVESLRSVDICARYGGEEFVFLLPNTDEENARKVAERVRGKVSSSIFTFNDSKIKVTVSIGISTFPGDGRKREELLEKADEAMYQAKHKGRNRVIHIRDILKNGLKGEE